MPHQNQTTSPHLELDEDTPVIAKKMLYHAENHKQIRHEDYIASMGKGMAILDCFSPERQRLNSNIAAEKTGMTRAAARRHLLTLEYLGYLEFDGHYYYLSPKILKFSGAYLSGAQLPKVCQPLLNILSMQTHLTYSVMVLDGHEAITIARSAAQSQGDRISPYGLHLGNRLPAHATSAGKILLAYLPETQLQQWIQQYPLSRFTPYSCTNIDELLSLFEQIKQQGWCYSSEQHELGVHALAVPIYDQHSHVVAALNIVTSPSRIDQKQLQQEILPLLQETARALRGML